MLHFNLYRNLTYAEEVHRCIVEDNDNTIDREVFEGMEGELTQAHIDKGKVNSCKHCPVALALQAMLDAHADKIGQRLIVEVNRLYIHFYYGAKYVLLLRISGLLEQWIDDFDAGRKLVPGKLYVEKGGLVDGIEGGKVQTWDCGIDVPDAYYIDPLGEDDTVDWDFGVEDRRV